MVKRSNISFKTVEINYGTYKISERIHSKIGENCYLADNATIIGDVVIGKDCSIWFNAVLRGDVNAIRIGNRVNIQDGSVVHTLYQKSVVEIGNDVSVGHNVTIHGATIKDGALIGMGSTILDHAVVGEGAIVAAGALVLSNTVIEPEAYGQEFQPNLSKDSRGTKQRTQSENSQWIFNVCFLV